MKRALVLALMIVGLLGIMAFATSGPYVDFKQGLTILETCADVDCISPPAWLEFGWDFELSQTFADPCPETDPCGAIETDVIFTLDGNIYFANSNIWANPAAYVTGIDLDLRWKDWGVSFDTEVDLMADFDYWPNFVGIDDWAVNVEFTRYFGPSFLSSGVDLWYQHYASGAWLHVWPYIRVKMYF